MKKLVAREKFSSNNVVIVNTTADFEELALYRSDKISLK
jgi:hypothetical protein